MSEKITAQQIKQKELELLKLREEALRTQIAANDAYLLHNNPQEYFKRYPEHKKYGYLVAGLAGAGLAGFGYGTYKLHQDFIDSANFSNGVIVKASWDIDNGKSKEDVISSIESVFTILKAINGLTPKGLEEASIKVSEDTIISTDMINTDIVPPNKVFTWYIISLSIDQSKRPEFIKDIISMYNKNFNNNASLDRAISNVGSMQYIPAEQLPPWYKRPEGKKALALAGGLGALGVGAGALGWHLTDNAINIAENINSPWGLGFSERMKNLQKRQFALPIAGAVVSGVAAGVAGSMADKALNNKKEKEEENNNNFSFLSLDKKEKSRRELAKKIALGATGLGSSNFSKSVEVDGYEFTDKEIEKFKRGRDIAKKLGVPDKLKDKDSLISDIGLMDLVGERKKDHRKDALKKLLDKEKNFSEKSLGELKFGR